MACAQQATGLRQSKIGELLGVSRRTAQRYADTGVPSGHLPNLARVVFPSDPDLAAEMAARVGQSLESLGLVAPPPPPEPAAPAPPPQPAPPADGVVDAVVCAAAEAMDVKPRDVRPGLLAAIARAREIGVPIDQVERVLRQQVHGALAAEGPVSAAAAGTRKASDPA
jgi:hypothetical protein